MGKRIRKPRSNTKDFIGYLAMRCATTLVQITPANLNCWVARMIGCFIFKCYHRGRNRAINNLKASYPEKTDAWILQTARSSFEHLLMMVFDIFKTPQLITEKSIKKYFDIDPHEVKDILAHIESQKGIIMITGHYGNFEALGYALAATGLKNNSIGRPIDNPYIDNYLISIRQKMGQTVISKHGATDEMIDTLAQGKILSLVADQNGNRKDVFVDFFGRSAATYKSIGLLAMNQDVPIVVGYCRRLHKKYKFKIGIARFITPDMWAKHDNPLQWITQEYTTAIEDFVREAPEQYWWLHQRWKTRPAAERKAAQLAVEAKSNQGS